MQIREAIIDDISQIQIIRNAVKENILSNPNLVTDADCIEFITLRGKGWVCEIDGNIVGFAIADLKENNIWALFIHPEFEKKELANNCITQCSIGISVILKLQSGFRQPLIRVPKHFIEKLAGRQLDCMAQKRLNLNCHMRIG